MSARIIGSSDEEDEIPPTSTPCPRKKLTMQLNEFDASMIAPESNLSKFNSTIVQNPKYKQSTFKERQRQVMLYSSDEDGDEQVRTATTKSDSSILTIPGTPSTEEVKTLLQSEEGSSRQNSPESRPANPEPHYVTCLSPDMKDKTVPLKQTKFQFRPLHNKMKVAATSTVKTEYHNQADTIPLIYLADQVSQIKLEAPPSTKPIVVVDDLTESFQSIVQIDDDSIRGTQDSSPDVIVVSPPAPRRIEPPKPRTTQNELLPKEQKPRQMIFLSEPPAIVPANIPVELRAGVGSLIEKLQRIISSIPTAADDLRKPANLKVDLYEHQKYGLTWMWWREQMEPYGGILADEMGLGKTVMVLALTCRGMEEYTKENEHRGPSSWTSVAPHSRLVQSRTTLVVCPPSVMGQWEDEIRKKTRGLNLYTYHGPSRTKSASELSKYDIVLTTFNTVGSDIPKLTEQTAEACRSPLVRVNWERVVLDEGHIIRNPKTCGAQAACRLVAKHRWIVTGTPVHNKPSDMFSLVKFLRMSPFDDQKVWDAWIGMKSVSRQNAERLNTVARALLLRRSKDEVMCGLEGTVQSIPPKTVVDVYVDLKPDEKEIYDHLNTFATKEFRDFLKTREQKTAELQYAADHFLAGRRNRVRPAEEKSFSHIFVLILRLRQCSVLPHLIHTMIEDDDDVDFDTDFDPEEDLISMKNPVFSEEFQSAKLDRMYTDLHDLKKKCRDAGERMEKVVIVSQWTTLLGIVAKHLERMHFNFVTISGEVKISDRMDIMSKFNNNPGRPEIMLLSLAAGGVGLNLTGANHLFFLDIHWNPQLELQAQDRIHRFGQKKPVTIRRYISRGTMEERVVDLQKEKLALADGILNSAQKKNGGGLRIEEMRTLFGI